MKVCSFKNRTNHWVDPVFLFYFPFLLLIFWASSLAAQTTSVPAHLSTFAKSLIDKASENASDNSNNESLSKAQLQKIKKILSDARTRHWASKDVVMPGMQKNLAEKLSLDLNQTSQWNSLREIIYATDPMKRKQLLRELQRGMGKSTDDASIARLATVVDETLLKSLEGLEESYQIETINGDYLNMYWNKLASEFQLKIITGDKSKQAGEGFETTYSGRVIQKSSHDSDGVTFGIEDKPPEFLLITDDDADKLAKSIFGLWRDDRGHTWMIEDKKYTQEGSNGRQNAAQQIARLEREINDISSSKVYVWKDRRSGKLIRQTKFKRLGEAYEYTGPQLAHKNADAQITRKKAEIEALKKQAPSLPVDEYKPTNRGISRSKDGLQSRSITVSVTYPDGYQFIYDTAEFDGRRLLTRRTLRSEKDITNLPKPVTSQLIASWSPPEWVELEVVTDGDRQKPVLKGLLWRLHVTYTPPGGFWGGTKYEIGSIHTPYSRNLLLTDGREQRAMGAGKEQLP